MIEFTFGVYPPPGEPPSFEHIGFKSLNIRNAMISGIEVTLAGEGRLWGLETYFSAGYSFINPVDLDVSNPDSTEHILKYRNKHSAKADAEFRWKKLSSGMTIVYNSFMINVDEAFVTPFPGSLILPGYATYREEHQSGYIVFDHRVSFRATPSLTLAIITKNLFNREYMVRPGDIRPPRNISLRVSVNF